MDAGVLASHPIFAIFQREGRPTVAVTFFRGRTYNRFEDGFTLSYCANGEVAMDLGMDLDEVDEAYCSLKGLRTLQQIMGSAAYSEPGGSRMNLKSETNHCP